MGIMKVVQCRTFFLQSAVGLWLFLGSLLPICSIRLGLSGRSKSLYFKFSESKVCFALLTNAYVVVPRVVEDFRDWTNWLLYRGGIGVKGEESWEAWWDEELVISNALSMPCL